MRQSPPRGSASRGRRRQKRSVAVTYGVVSATLLLVIAAVALIVKPPSPPALAEFAPQTDQTIDDTVDNQSSQFGTGGDGMCSAGQVGCEGLGRPATTLPPEDEEPQFVPRPPGRRCVGTPERQIDDPQSPPCAPPWQGDNGGATSMGVTRDEIRVALAPSSQGSSFADLERVTEFFNTRFEFYGRRIVLVNKTGQPATGQGAPREETLRRTADAVAEARPFAALRIGLGDSQFPYQRRLAEHRIVSIHPDDDFTSEAELRSLHPYAWNYQLSHDRQLTDMAQFVCRSLASGRADYAGSGVRGQARAIGVVKIVLGATGDDGRFGDIQPLLSGLEKECGGPRLVKEYRYDDGDTGGTKANSFMADLQNSGITTVVIAGAPGPAGFSLMPAATRLQYYPEWVIAGVSLSEFSWQPTLGDPAQTPHLIALGGWNKGLPSSDRPSAWAYNEQGVPIGPTNDYHRLAETFYQSLLVLASGIQAAGPRLTPETFGRGLQQLRFPNPGAGAWPYYQAKVGFTGDHTMIDDEALQWWSASAPAYRGGKDQGGGWCYIERGARWGRDAWPRQTFPLFDPNTPCR